MKPGETGPTAGVTIDAPTMTRPQDAPAPGERSGTVDPFIGVTFAGRYTVRRLLARDGAGTTYLAEQSDPQREVVVRVLACDPIDGAAAVARFERDGQRLTALKHPNLVSLYECGRDHELAYVAREYLVGDLLSVYLARRGGPMTLANFVPIAAQILKGLGYAHSRGLVHRDVRPSNIMLCVRKGRANFVKLLDFGLATLVAGEREVSPDPTLGAADYLAPEQRHGGVVDARVDVYALGVLFYEMLAGHRPLDHTHAPPPPLGPALPADHGVPEGLIELVMQCLEEDPEARPADADAMVEALIDCVPAALFNLPVADGATGASSSTLTPAIASATLDLTIPGITRPAPPPPPPAARPLASEPRLATASTSSTASIASTASTSSTASTASTTEATHPRVGRSPADAATLESFVAPRQGRRTIGVVGILIGCAVALLVGGLFAAIYFLGDRTDPAPAAAPVVDPHAPDRDRTVEILDHVDDDILAGEFERARTSLDDAAAEIDAIPDLRQRAEHQRDRIAVATTFASAQRLERDGKLEAALGAYQDLLAIDPSHVDARSAVRRLRASTTPPPTILMPPGEEPVVRKPGKPGKPGEVAPTPPGTTARPPSQPVKPPPAVEPDEEDPFLPVGKRDDGVFLPVGGTQ